MSTAPLISREYVTDKLWQEDPTNSDKGRAIYHDHVGTDHRSHETPGLHVEVEYDTHALQPYSRKLNFEGKKVTFESRDSLLDHEVARRMSEAKDLPDSERYVGYKLTLFQKIKRLFGMSIDGELQDDWTNVLKPNYSAKNVYNMTNTFSPSKSIREQLGIEASDTHKLSTKVTWAFNSSLNGYEYVDEQGKKVEIRNGVTSSNDRTTRNVCMMRRISDLDTGETLAYTGRPDTREKAIEQIEFIVRSELKSGKPKGLVKDEHGYTLTYAVNNLMSPLTGIGLVSFDEKGAVLNEQEIFRELDGQTILVDGHKVRIKPLYFSQPFNQTNSLTAVITDSHNGTGRAQEINEEGYRTLIPMAQEHLKHMEKGNQKDLVEGAIKALNGDFGKLLPEEEFFNRAILCLSLNIPMVDHCKSSTDRTILALAVALLAHQWQKIDADLIKNEKDQVVPHLILKTDAAKEIVAGHCLSGHQVTRVSRTCEGVVKGHEIGTKILGFEWSSNPVAGRILPERYTKVNEVSPVVKGAIGFFSTLGFLINLALAIPIWLVGTAVTRTPLFNPIYIKPGLSPFAERLIDKKSPYVGKGEGRSLIKPSGMISL